MVYSTGELNKWEGFAAYGPGGIEMLVYEGGGILLLTVNGEPAYLFSERSSVFKVIVNIQNKKPTNKINGCIELPRKEVS